MQIPALSEHMLLFVHFQCWHDLAFTQTFGEEKTKASYRKQQLQIDSLLKPGWG